MTRALSAPVTDADHTQGPDTAPVTLVEYGDYQCPYTGRAFSVVEELQDRFGDHLRFVYRHFPLVDQHPRAMPAALAAEAASDRDAGTFWVMHNLLMTHQDRLSDEDLAGYAERLGMASAGAIGEGSRRHIARVERDLHSGQASGVLGTPTFFINGVLFEGDPDFDSLSAAFTSVLDS
jgi:protein-disulfide isomerase